MFHSGKSTGLIPQARHGNVGWQHGSGAHHKDAIGQRYPFQLGGAVCTITQLNSLLIHKNSDNPPSPDELLSKGARIADIKASAKASEKTTVCIVLKQGSNSRDYGQVSYLEK
jgi:hypothetical protein